MVAWLDQFSRNFEEGVRTRAEFTMQNIGIVAINEGRRASTPPTSAISLKWQTCRVINQPRPNLNLLYFYTGPAQTVQYNYTKPKVNCAIPGHK